ncbi:MAG: efflux RND transporter permease subunit [Devosia nanyangense]|uniref:Efflux RND transporter permease subunit n=1 Tax=Devosia nanyangense TaxID=1228055 RepID=A0A933NXW2_9HYPH|nr:efflux RND transporter permease subunit [Devosia nanyangense]
MMNFLERILRMPRVVLTVMGILLFAGVLSYVSLPKESFPAIDIPYFYISVSQTGVSPADAERLLGKPIEDRVKDTDGLVNYTTTSSTGHASVLLEFDVNADKDKALADVRAKLDGVTGELPDDATTPTVTTVSTASFPSISVAVYGDVPERALVQKAKDLQDALEKLPDVQSADISGSRDEMLAVTIDLDRLEAYNLTASQLFDALAKNNLVVPGGTLDTGQGSFNVEVPGLITTAADVYSLPIKTSGDTVVTFGDVAQITRTFKDATSYAYVNGAPAITLSIVKKLGTNVINVVDQVKAATAEEVETWPAGMQHSFLLDQSESAKSLFNSLQAAVLTAVALVLITCVATLGLRPAIMIGMSIPISFMIAFLVTSMLGMTLNMMIMFGLVLAVGVLVDDPIVVVEYAERKLQEGVPKREAFIMAAKKMFVPVVSATFTTLSAFVVLLFWPGIIGKFMSYLPTIVIVVMCASLASALIFMPIIGAIIAKTHVDPVAKAKADIVMYPDKFDTKKVGGITGVYVRMMAKLLHYPLITLPVGFAIIVAIFMFAHPAGFVAFPNSEPEQGTVNVIARGNYSPVEIRNMLLEVESKILTVEGIQDSVMAFGGGGGGFGGGSSPPDTIGSFQLQLLPWADRITADVIFQSIRDKVKDIPGLEIQIAAQENGPPAGKAINLRVDSTNYADLEPVVTKLRSFVENDLGDTIDVEDGRPAPGIDWQVTVDRVAAAKYGIGVRELSPYVQLVTSGVKIGAYRPDDSTDELDIRVRLPKDERTFDALDSLRITTANGLVPVSNFITRKAVPKVATLTRRDGVYSMSVAANLKPDVNSDSKVQLVKAWEQEQIKAGTIPVGTHIVYGGADEQMAETGAFISKAFLVALALIALILLLEYNSFWQVLVTITTIGMSLAGVMLGLAITQTAFSMIMTGLGIVALAGIVVKNGIVLTDTYNHYNRDDGVEPIKAMLITISQRVRPVLLTATVTALGVIPMALNVEFDFIGREINVGGLAGTWFVALSTALVSGLFVSTALTLVMVPVMIVAPKVAGHQVGGFFVGLWHLPGRMLAWIGGLVRRPGQAVTPEGEVVDVPDSAQRFLTKEVPDVAEPDATRHAAE